MLREALYDVVDDRAEQRPTSLDPQNPRHSSLAERLESAMAAVRAYRSPFTVTEYQILVQDGRPAIQENPQGGKTLVKPMTKDLAERLRGLGYVQ